MPRSEASVITAQQLVDKKLPECPLAETCQRLGLDVSLSDLFEMRKALSAYYQGIGNTQPYHILQAQFRDWLRDQDENLKRAIKRVTRIPRIRAERIRQYHRQQRAMEREAVEQKVQAEPTLDVTDSDPKLTEVLDTLNRQTRGDIPVTRFTIGSLTINVPGGH